MIFSDIQMQSAFFPALRIAHDGLPGTCGSRGKAQLIVLRISGFQAEDLNQGPGILLKEEAGRNDLGIVEHHQGIFRQIVRQRAEFSILRHSSGRICVHK